MNVVVDNRAPTLEGVRCSETNRGVEGRVDFGRTRAYAYEPRSEREIRTDIARLAPADLHRTDRQRCLAARSSIGTFHGRVERTTRCDHSDRASACHC